MDYTEDKIKRVIAQIIRNLLQEYAGVTFRSDPTGILVWCLNIPLMIIGYKVLGRMFMLKTIAVISMQSMLMTVIKGPEAQLISDHALNCVCGGALSGFGIGMLLRSGASGGGTDIVGMVAAKKKPGVSVGSISMSINVFIFAYAAITRSFEIQNSLPDDQGRSVCRFQNPGPRSGHLRRDAPRRHHLEGGGAAQPSAL